jgi:hypothetical protein
MAKRFRLRFGLRALLAATAVAAVACYVLSCHLAAQAAQEDLERVYAAYDAGLKTNKEIYIASRRLCEAACRVPLGNKVAAHATHLARMYKLHERVEYLVNIGLFASDPAPMLVEVDGYCEEAEAGLEAVLGRRLLP